MRFELGWLPVVLAVFLTGCSTPAEKQAKDVQEYLGSVSLELKDSADTFTKKFVGKNINDVAMELELDMTRAWSAERGDLIVPFERFCSINVRAEAGTNRVVGLHIPTKEEIYKDYTLGNRPVFDRETGGYRGHAVTVIPFYTKQDYFISVGKCERFISLMKKYK